MKMKIENNVPLPTDGARGRKASKESELALKMRPGDSLLCFDKMIYKRIIRVMAKKGIKYVSRKEGDGWRVWRLDGRKVRKSA